MCGVVGFASTEGSVGYIDRAKFFRNALIADVVRGPHSTGMFTVGRSYANSKDKIQVLKKAFNPLDFLELKQVDSALNNFNTIDIAIGHNRWATMGAVTHDTAHPFQHGDVTMVHNGTLDYYSDLPGAKNFDVDSEAICFALSQVAPEDAKKVLETLQGAYALIWFDARIGKLRAARNDERPLHFAHTTDDKNLLIASESGMLSWLAGRHGFKTREIWQLAPGKLITLDREDLTQYDVEDFIPFEDVYTTGYRYHGTDNFGFRSNDAESGGARDVAKKRWSQNEKLLRDYGLTSGSKISFDADEFHYYPNSGGKEKPAYGRLVGEYETPTGDIIRVEVEGLKGSECEDMEGFHIAVEVLNIIHLVDAKGVSRPVLKCKEPQWVPDDGDDDNEEVTVQKTGHFVERYGPFNSFITNDQWNKLRSEGCNMCQGPIDEDDDDQTGWNSSGKPICKHCMNTYGWNGTIN